MATARLILLLLCTYPAFGHWLPQRHLLKHAAQQLPPVKQEASDLLLQLASAELGVRERSGRNDGPRVESYLQYVGMHKGQAWCAAFVCWLHGQAGLPKPRSGWSPALFPSARRISNARAGAILGIYFPRLNRIGHVGLVTGLQHDWVNSIEGNTNAAGSREGDGVYRKLRHKRFINQYAFYLPER